MAAARRNIPTLRFPEFEGEWEISNIEDIAEVVTGNKDTQNKIDKGAYPFFVRSDNVERINSYTFDGEAILTSGDGVGVGKNFHYIVGKFDFHQRVYSIRNFVEKVSGKYFYYYFSKYFYRRVMRLSAKNSVDSIRRTMITEMAIPLGVSLEQQKIASFLTAVDEKIGGLSKKKDFLEQYKTGVMQKLFSQTIRFTDDHGNPYPDWEEKKLGDIAIFSKGKGISKSDIVIDGERECIRYGELYTHYGETIDDIKSRTNIEVDQLVLSEENDVIIPASGETQIDIATASCVLKKGVALSGDLNVIRSPLHGVFLSYYLNSALKLDIARLSQGISVVHLYPSHLRSLGLQVPHQKEQKKIANFLSSLDQKIDHVSKQLDQAQNFKKGLLQQMFV